jgi:Rrf2 family protein
MISQTAEYALRAAVYLATSLEHPRPAWEISEATRIPASYLAKVLGSLARAGLVQSQRGPRGGFHLARSPQSVTLLELIRAVEAWKGLEECPLGLPEHAHQLCPLHRKLAEAYSCIEEAFRGCTLDMLVGAGTPDGCPFVTKPAA